MKKKLTPTANYIRNLRTYQAHISIEYEYDHWSGRSQFTGYTEQNVNYPQPCLKTLRTPRHVQTLFWSSEASIAPSSHLPSPLIKPVIHFAVNSNHAWRGNPKISNCQWTITSPSRRVAPPMPERRRITFYLFQYNTESTLKFNPTQVSSISKFKSHSISKLHVHAYQYLPDEYLQPNYTEGRLYLFSEYMYQ